MDLRALARDVVEMTRARWHDQAEVKGLRYDVFVEGSAVPLVLGDAADLREALTNLVFNALDAMPQGGRLTLRTVVDGSRVRCDVADTGMGMSPELRERVFEPFFTTKTEKGSGLGLSIVYGTITRLGGEIAVESTPGVGSAFRMWLPTAGEDLVASAEGRLVRGRPGEPASSWWTTRPRCGARWSTCWSWTDTSRWSARMAWPPSGRWRPRPSTSSSPTSACRDSEAGRSCAP